MGFVHLHTHTEYSLLDGSNKIKEYVARVKELGMNAAAITDHGVMYGVIDFYRAAKKAGINPVIGCEVYVAPGSRFEKEGTATGDDKYYHLVLLAETQEGYDNLMKIVSMGFVEGFYYKPRVDLELLRQYHKGIIALSACLAGAVSRELTRGDYDRARETALVYKEIFGEGNYYLELQDHGIPEQQQVNMQLLRMSKDTGIPLVATNDIHYTLAQDWKAHDVLLCIQTNKKVTDEDRMRYEGGQFYVKSPEEMKALFPYAPEALENTQRIADRCHVEIEFGNYKLPKYPVPQGTTAVEYLEKKCLEGLSLRYGASENLEELKNRLGYELDTIKTMGFVDYFLIVWDFIKYARDHGIAVGPGRGSAAGSIVAYSLGITNIDPIRYQLLFERFLNPERVSMPDIDVDFCVDRRQEVIDYVGEKYGKDHVAQIVTFGTMAARAVIRDVARALDYPYAFADSIAKQIPRELNITLDGALEKNPELRRLYETDPRVTELLDMSRRLEGLPRNTSMHAAGVVISPKAVDEFVPLSKAQDGSITTQFTMVTLEELGLLKMDFLGLRTLTVIQNACKLASEEGRKIDIDRIDYDDPAIYQYISTGKTEGVFQLESPGMKGFMKELAPTCMEDVIAGISLYRPGPMDFIPKYIKWKNHPENIVYDCPELEHILAPTYGCIVYQEQVMQIVRDLAGFSLGRSDNLRRAMSKKKAEVMAKERKAFVYGDPDSGVPGCISKGIPEHIANKIYDDMVDFAKYAFNKSHAAAYAVVAYQTAYLKYYYPVEFMAALMTSFLDNAEKVAEYIYVCRQMGIEILPPDINSGGNVFTVDHRRIRYCLAAIKSVGRPVISAIERERGLGGSFRNLKDFIERMSGSEVNKRAVENFIKAGAMDGFGATRKQLVMVYGGLMDAVAHERKNTVAGQISLFDIVDDSIKSEFDIPMPDVGEYDREVLLNFEKEVLGVYVSGHPLEEYEEIWKRSITNTTGDFALDDTTGRAKVKDGARAVLGGIIQNKTVKYLKDSKTMCFLTLEDIMGTAEIIVFPRQYEKYNNLMEQEAKIFVEGKVSEEEDKPSKLIAERIVPLTKRLKELWIRFPDKKSYLTEEKKLLEMTENRRGDTTVVVYLVAERAVKRLPERCNIFAESPDAERISQCFGSENVKIVDKTVSGMV